MGTIYTEIELINARDENLFENGYLTETQIRKSKVTVMADTGAIFGGEHSGHFYFADFWKADSGALAALYAIAELSASKKTLSELLAPLNRYVSSGEINTKVSDHQAAVNFVRESFKQDYAIDELDGVTVTGPDWWFNVRPSNTEPLLRLNVEAKTPERMKQVRDQVLALFR